MLGIFHRNLIGGDDHRLNCLIPLSRQTERRICAADKRTDCAFDRTQITRFWWPGPSTRSTPFSVGIPVTSRELAVRNLAIDGLIAAAIAGQLGISPRTVSKHIDNI